MKTRKAFPTPLDDGNRIVFTWVLWWTTWRAVTGCPASMEAVLREGPLHA
jgi:hypothetical protein